MNQSAGYVLVWEFEVASDRREAFERMYGADGGWVRLFRLADGFLGTTLLCSPGQPARYLTIDRWTDADAYERFRREHRADYARLDQAGEQLTVAEREIGAYADVERPRLPRQP